MSLRGEQPIRLLVGVLSALLLGELWAACGDEESEEPPKEEWPASAGPLTVDDGLRGIYLERLRSTNANRSRLTSDAERAGALFVYAQIESEYVEATEGASAQASAVDELDSTFEQYGEDEIPLYDAVYLLIDLQRRDRAWLVDWQGRQRDEPENRPDSLNFARDDYKEDVLDRLTEIVERFPSAGIVIGLEMNRYYSQNPGDWSNFVAFFWQLYDAIKAVDGNARVAVGFNWSYLMESQVAEFVQSGESAGDVEPFRRAFDTIVRPLVYRTDEAGNVVGQSDFVAVAAIPDPTHHGQPAAVPDTHFAGLRLMFGSTGMPLVWFQVGWPVSNAGSSDPARFWERFVTLAGGTNVERVGWWGFTHLFEEGECTTLTGERVGASQTICFRGLYSVSGADSAVSEAYFGE